MSQNIIFLYKIIENTMDLVYNNRKRRGYMYKLAIILITILLLMSGCNNNTKINDNNGTELDFISTQKDELPSVSRYITNDYPDVQMKIVPDKSTDKIMVIEFINNDKEEIVFSSSYVIEFFNNGAWYEMPTKLKTDFTSEGYIVEAEGTRQFSFEYADLYELENYTKYRIVKMFYVNEDKYYLSDEFEIKICSNE